MENFVPAVLTAATGRRVLIRFFFQIVMVMAACATSQAVAKSTWPAPPRLKKIPESAIPPVAGVPRDIDKVKFQIADTHAFDDKKMSAIPMWYWDGLELAYAGTIAPGGTFQPEAIFGRSGRMYYGTSKLDSMQIEPWLEKQRTRYKNKVFTVYLDGGYLKRID